MRRSTLLMLLTGAGAAVLSYTPTAAQWLTIGREQGYVPETVPSEVTDPPVIAAAGLTIFTTLCVMLFRFLYTCYTDASATRTAIVGEALRQSMERAGGAIIAPQGGSGIAPAKGTATHGRDIISSRKRLAENREEIKVADEAEAELKRERIEVQKQLADSAAMVTMASEDCAKAQRELDRVNKYHADVCIERTRLSQRAGSIDAQLGALSAAKQQLLAEQRDLV